MKPADTINDSASTTRSAVESFNQAFARRDVDAVMAAMTPDCVFENTSPPDGVAHRGHADVRAAWNEFFASSPDAMFETEDDWFAGDRAIVTWIYRWQGTDPGQVRGVDLFLVRHGKVAEKRSYVKG